MESGGCVAPPPPGVWVAPPGVDGLRFEYRVVRRWGRVVEMEPEAMREGGVGRHPPRNHRRPVRCSGGADPGTKYYDGV